MRKPGYNPNHQLCKMSESQDVKRAGSQVATRNPALKESARMNSTKNGISGQRHMVFPFPSRTLSFTPDGSHIAAGSVATPAEPGNASRIAGPSRRTSRAVQESNKAIRTVLTDEARQTSGITTRANDCLNGRIQKTPATSQALDRVGAIPKRQSGFTG